MNKRIAKKKSKQARENYSGYTYRGQYRRDREYGRYYKEYCLHFDKRERWEKRYPERVNLFFEDELEYPWR